MSFKRDKEGDKEEDGKGIKVALEKLINYVPNYVSQKTRDRTPVPQPGEDLGAAGDTTVQRDTGQCPQMHPHSHQNPLFN